MTNKLDKRYIQKQVQKALYAAPEVRRAEDGSEPVSDWSPNNLRKVILSPEGIVTQWYTTQNTKFKTRVQFTPFSDLEATVYSLSTTKHDYLKHLSANHKFSNLEEVIVLPASPNGLSFNVDELWASLKLDTFKRLAARAVAVEPMELGQFLTENKDAINDRKELLTSTFTPDRYSVRELNKQYYNSKELRGFYYELDQPGKALSKELNNTQTYFANKVDKTDITKADNLSQVNDLVARNNMLTPLIDKVVAPYLALMTFINKRSLQSEVVLDIPTTQAFFGLDIEPPKTLPILTRLDLVTANPGTNAAVLMEFYNAVLKGYTDIFTLAGIQDVYDVSEYVITSPTDVNRLITEFDSYNTEVLHKLLTNETLSVKTPEGYEPFTEEQEVALDEVIVELLSTVPVGDTIKVANNILAHADNKYLLLGSDFRTTKDILISISPEFREYVKYSLFLNFGDSNSHYYSKEVNGYKILSLDAVPSKHFNIKEEELEAEVEDLDLELTDPFGELVEDLGMTDEEYSHELFEVDSETGEPLTDMVDDTEYDDGIEEEYEGDQEEEAYELSEADKRKLEAFKSSRLRSMWSDMQVTEQDLAEYITSLEHGTLETKLGSFVKLVKELRTKAPTVLNYMVRKANLAGKLVAVGEYKYSGIRSETVNIVQLTGDGLTFEDLVTVSHKLLKYEEGR